MSQILILFIAVVLYLLACIFYKDEHEKQKPKSHGKPLQFQPIVMQRYKGYSAAPKVWRSTKE